jgi:hypothetical protein
MSTNGTSNNRFQIRQQQRMVTNSRSTKRGSRTNAFLNPSSSSNNGSSRRERRAVSCPPAPAPDSATSSVDSPRRVRSKSTSAGRSRRTAKYFIKTSDGTRRTCLSRPLFDRYAMSRLFRAKVAIGGSCEWKWFLKCASLLERGSLSERSFFFSCLLTLYPVET